MSTEYLDLTQFEPSTVVNYTQLYNNDMLKIDTNAKNTANNIVSISTDVDSIKNDVIDAENNINSVNNNINTIENDINTIKDDVTDINNSINNINIRIEDLDGYIDNAGNAVDSIRQDIAIIDGDLYAVTAMANDLQKELNAEKQNIAGLNEMIGNIGDRIDTIQPRTESFFAGSYTKSVTSNDTLHYVFAPIQLPAYIMTNDTFNIHYQLSFRSQNGCAVFMESVANFGKSIINNNTVTTLVGKKDYAINGKYYIEEYYFTTNGISINTSTNKEMSVDITISSARKDITFSGSTPTVDTTDYHNGGYLFFSFELYKK